MSELGSNIWGIVAGVLGTLGLVPIVISILKTQYPSEKLRAVDQLVAETKQLLDSGVAEGLLSHEEFQLILWSSMGEINELRAQIYGSDTWKKEFRNWRKGLSKKLTVISYKWKNIMAIIAKSSAEERRRLDAVGKTAEFILSIHARDAAWSSAPHAERAIRPPASSALLATLHSTPQSTTLPDAIERPTPQPAWQDTQAFSYDSTLCEEPIAQEGPTVKGHSLIDADLDELLARIAARRARRPADAKSKPGRFLPRQDLLRRFGRQLSSPGPSQTASCPTELVPQAQAKRAGLKESLARLFRSADGHPPHTGLEDGNHR